MVIYKCDRCHKELTNKKLHHMICELSGGWWNENSYKYDLCKKCAKEVSDSIKNYHKERKGSLK